MTDRYYIVTHDWQRFDRRYAVVDGTTGRAALQTNDFARAIEFRDELNQIEAAAEYMDRAS